MKVVAAVVGLTEIAEASVCLELPPDWLLKLKQREQDRPEPMPANESLESSAKGNLAEEPWSGQRESGHQFLPWKCLVAIW